MLSDKDKKARYDQFGIPASINSAANCWRRDPFGGFGGVDFGDIFEQLFGGFGGTGRRQANQMLPGAGATRKLF